MEGGAKVFAGVSFTGRTRAASASPQERSQVMFVSKTRLIPAVVACVVGLGAGGAMADDGSSQQQQQQQTQLQQRIDQLEAKVQTLQSQQSQDQANVTAAIQQVVAQADAQSKLLDTESAGLTYDAVHGLHFASDDGNFYLHPWALFQFQGIGTVTTGDRGVSAVQTNDGNTNTGFQMRHMEFGIEGHAFGPNLHYDLQMESFGGAFVLEDAYATYRLSDTCPISLKAGQFEDPTWHEGIVDDAHQMAMDRSLLNALIGSTFGTQGFTTDRVEGVGIVYKDKALRSEVDLTDGFNSANAPFTGVPLIPASVGVAHDPPENLGLNGRVEYALMGGDNVWHEYDHFSSLGDKHDLLVVGTGVEWTEAEDIDAVQWTVDAQFNTASGIAIYGAFLSDFVNSGSDANHPANGVATTDYGFLIQAGYMLNPQWEVFARYDITLLDKKDIFNAASAHPELTVHEIDLGVNWYLYGQRIKATLQGALLPSGSPVPSTSLGILADPRKFECIGEAQLQLLL
jgi:hypothetical protein